MDFSQIHLDDHQELARIIVMEAVKKDLKDRRAFQILTKFFCEET